MEVWAHSMLMGIVPASLIEHLRTLHRDPCWVRLLTMGLIDEAMFVRVNVNDHLKGDGRVTGSSSNAQMAEDAIED